MQRKYATKVVHWRQASRGSKLPYSIAHRRSIDICQQKLMDAQFLSREKINLLDESFLLDCIKTAYLEKCAEKIHKNYTNVIKISFRSLKKLK
jgi:hypothetical protein